MQFLKTLFWVVLTVILVLFAKANWIAVPLRLWGGLEADVKLPILILFAFLIGFLPTFVLHRARLWSLRRRLDPAERSSGTVSAPPPATPVTVTNSSASDRLATDSKAWPS
jgi:lipopolysaccharide assembly protein A